MWECFYLEMAENPHCSGSSIRNFISYLRSLGKLALGYLSSSMMSSRAQALFIFLLLSLTCYLFNFRLIALWLPCPCPSTGHQNCIQTEEPEGRGSEAASLHFFSLGKIVFQNPSSKFPLISN